MTDNRITAEQVRNAIRKYAEDDSCYIFEIYGEMCGPVADELNAELMNKQAIAATLTAEQVRKALYDCSTYASYDGCTCHASGIRLQALTDKLNSELGRPKHE